MQQAESQNINQETAAVNGDANDAAAPVQVEEVDTVPTYDQQFPSLGGGSVPVTTAPPIGRWNKKPPLQSTTITQVFHIPPEERKALNVEGFGGGESLKKLDAIMSSTQTKIEMSSGQDNSLTFLLTGKTFLLFELTYCAVTRLYPN